MPENPTQTFLRETLETDETASGGALLSARATEEDDSAFLERHAERAANPDAVSEPFAAGAGARECSWETMVVVSGQTVTMTVRVPDGPNADDRLAILKAAAQVVFPPL